MDGASVGAWDRTIYPVSKGGYKGLQNVKSGGKRTMMVGTRLVWTQIR